MLKKIKNFFSHPLHKHYTIVSCSHKRLLEHGFTPGTEVTLIDIKFFGNVFMIRGTMIGIRNEDMRSLTLKEKE